MKDNVSNVTLVMGVHDHGVNGLHKNGPERIVHKFLQTHMCPSLTLGFPSSINFFHKILREEFEPPIVFMKKSIEVWHACIIQAETFFFLSKEISTLYGMDFLEFNNLLNVITKDFQEHLRLLENIKNIISNKQKKNQVHHPIFVYQNPDAWITPISGREDWNSVNRIFSFWVLGFGFGVKI